jgi:hypothetical protein
MQVPRVKDNFVNKELRKYRTRKTNVIKSAGVNACMNICFFISDRLYGARFSSTHDTSIILHLCDHELALSLTCKCQPFIVRNRHLLSSIA